MHPVVKKMDLFKLFLLFNNLKYKAMDPFIGTIQLFAGNFAPKGWAFCEGQLLPISGHTALFSLIGTTYGGDGRTTFALPDLRGRVPVQPGTGPGLSEIKQGQKGGVATHSLVDVSCPAEADKEQKNLIQTHYSKNNNLPPFLGINYIIALEGIYPSRS